MRRTIETMCAVAILVGGVALSGDAQSKPGKRKGGKGASGDPSALTPASLAELTSDDPAVVRAGLDDARMAGPRGVAAVPRIVDLLRSGLPYGLAEAALDTLGDIELPDIEVLVPYASHRDANVRRAAIHALAKTTAPAGLPLAGATLRAALSDVDPQVRASAAVGLGSLKAPAAVPDLFLALDHHVYEAAASIGELCTAIECDALLGRLGRVPFDVITTGFDPILFRPAADVSDDAKVAIIDKVRDVGTNEANKFLRGVQGRWPKNGSLKVKRAIDAAVLATLSSPGAGS
jgi:HEAT repeat protein